MYDNFNNTNRSHGAFEIELRAKELEKRYALMNYLYHSQKSNGVAENFARAARRIGSLIGSLFL